MYNTKKKKTKKKKLQNICEMQGLMGFHYKLYGFYFLKS